MNPFSSLSLEHVHLFSLVSPLHRGFNFTLTHISFRFPMKTPPPHERLGPRERERWVFVSMPLCLPLCLCLNLTLPNHTSLTWELSSWFQCQIHYTMIDFVLQYSGQDPHPRYNCPINLFGGTRKAHFPLVSKRSECHDNVPCTPTLSRTLPEFKKPWQWSHGNLLPTF